MSALVLLALLFTSEGAHRVPNEHYLRGVESLGANKLVLVTFNRGQSDKIDVRVGVGDGLLQLSDADGDFARLYALSDNELEQMNRARSRDTLGAFFSRGNLARSESFTAWSFTSDPEDDTPNVIDWSIEGLDGYRIVMTPKTRLPSTPLKSGVLVVVGGLAALIVVFVIFLKRRLRSRA